MPPEPTPKIVLTDADEILDFVRRHPEQAPKATVLTDPSEIFELIARQSKRWQSGA